MENLEKLSNEYRAIKRKITQSMEDESALYKQIDELQRHRKELSRHMENVRNLIDLSVETGQDVMALTLAHDEGEIRDLLSAARMSATEQAAKDVWKTVSINTGGVTGVTGSLSGISLGSAYGSMTIPNVILNSVSSHQTQLGNMITSSNTTP